MTQLDAFSEAPAAPPFRDIRNTRPSVAEEKATLALRLGELIKRAPKRIASGSIQDTRRWVKEHAAAVKVARSTRASVFDLEGAIRRLEGFAD
jgi:hypothetical protein